MMPNIYSIIINPFKPGVSSTLFALSTGIFVNHGNNKNLPGIPFTGNGPVQRVKVEESSRHKWVKGLLHRYIAPCWDMKGCLQAFDIALILVNIVPSWDIEGRELASVLRYPNEGQYSPISV